ncbi:MAG TPA: helix-turn-helix transcriptional regulator, partial [Ktedonobacterales bacterium]|nr:helix-turn-helix transcriptional regulator [Ktedonobacterales bacterium]
MNAPLTAQQQEDAYLARLGERVRAWRTEHGMSRKSLALASGVSERYLAQLEAGQGNISVLLLRKVARAMGVAVERLVREEDTQEKPIALIGLRGAGKSTLGAKLAAALSLPFVELDREVEKEAGAPLAEMFAMYGQDAFRRFERRALERVLAEEPRAVIATGGSLVTDPGTYELLLERCRCVWLRASAQEHMARVLAQGDTRPFKGRSAALDEIRKLLADRERLYGRAGAVVDTSAKSVRQALAEL